MTYLIDFINILWNFSKRRSLSISFLTFLNSLTEGLGLVLLLPLLGLLQGSGDQTNGLSSAVMRGFDWVNWSPTLMGLILIFLCLLTLRSAIQYLFMVKSAQLQNDVVHAMQCDAFDAVMRANWRWVTGLKQSDHTNLLTNEIRRVPNGLSVAMALPSLILMITTYLVAAFTLSVGLTLVVLAVGAAIAILLKFQHRRALMVGHVLTTAQASLQQTIQEGIAGLKITKILGTEMRHAQKLDQALGDFKQQQIAFVRTNSKATFLFQMIVAVFLALVILAGLNLFHITFSALAVFVIILVRVAPMLRSFQMKYNQLLFAWPALQSFQDKVDAAKNQSDIYPDQGYTAPLAFDHAIDLRAVQFKYDSRETPAISDITLTIPANKTTAIVGPSGSGKSTLSDLLMGLLSPSQGEISVDGLALTPDTQVTWRRSVAYVPQDVFLFNDTVRNNILWANPQANDTDIKTALTHAAALFAYDLPQGVDTVVGDGGVMLSGGERQRIALARALLQDPKLLILDEATSALDIENEHFIRDSIQKLKGQRTVIVVGHRLPTLDEADQVIALKKGQLDPSHPQHRPL